MKIGKLTNPELIDCVFGVIKKRRDEVKVRSSLAQDCSSFEIDDTILISTDPITGADEGAGGLAIKINANDIYAAGVQPVLAVITILAPPNATVEEIKRVMVDAENEAERNNIEIVGGHTEFTDAVNKIVVSVTIIGKTDKHITADSAKAGDSIILTKTIGIEGTVILAHDYEKKLRAFLTDDELEQAKQLKNSISITVETLIARRHNNNAMHDITEGGLFGALAEMAQASGVGAVIETDKVKTHPVTEKICSSLGVDKYRLISSGSLLISAPRPKELLEAFEQAGIQAAVVGKFNDTKEIIADFGDRQEKLSTKYDQLFDAVKRCK